MSVHLADIFDRFNSVLVICPCCGEVCRLGDAQPHLKGRRPSTPFDRIEKETRRVERAEERFEERHDAMRDKARESGRRKARRMLKRVDPVFCGSGLDPQDVKVIFDPVEYVVFDGLSGERLRRILLMGEPPASKKQEKVHRSLASAVRKGNMEFLTLRVTKEGTVERGS